MQDNKEKANHPSHYNVGKFEVIDVIEDWKLNFNLGNAIKYIARADHKGNKVQELEKALWYIKREFEREVDSIVNHFFITTIYCVPCCFQFHNL